MPPRRRLGAEARVPEEAELTEPVVGGHHDHVAGLREPAPVVERVDRRADGVAAAVEPHQDRPRGPGRRGRPHVELQAVLVAARTRRRVELRARRAEPRRVQLLARTRRRCGRAEPQLADRRRRERHALERPGRAVARAAERPAGRAHDLAGGPGLGRAGRRRIRRRRGRVVAAARDDGRDQAREDRGLHARGHSNHHAPRSAPGGAAPRGPRARRSERPGATRVAVPDGRVAFVETAPLRGRTFDASSHIII